MRDGSIILILVFSLTPICIADAVLYEVTAPSPASTPELDSISSDGTAASGRAYLSGYTRVLRWTIDGSSELLTDADDGPAEGLGCSGAGIVVTAFAGLQAGLTGYRWTAADGWVVMPIPANMSWTVPRAISEDGLAIASWIVGTGGSALPARWTESLGYEILHDVPSDNVLPIVMSSDGSTIAGASSMRPFFWHRTNGLVLIPVEISTALRFGISFDGRFIAGSDQQGVWRYDRIDQTLLRLQRKDGAPVAGYPRGVSADGSIIVGQ